MKNGRRMDTSPMDLTKAAAPAITAESQRRRTLERIRLLRKAASVHHLRSCPVRQLLPLFRKQGPGSWQVIKSSTSDTSYITQPDTVLRPSLTETMFTTLSGSNEPSKEHTSLEYLLDHKELHNFARQIACGMKHLEEKKITHRDLAARNILINENKTLKISDFGLSRSGIYVNTKNKKVPLRWLSIEAMRDNLYSSKSDVWAFGIVLWEIGTLGGYPYPTVSNHELLEFLHNGNRLDRPENCSTELYDLMLHCWMAETDDRPSFDEIFKSLNPHRRIYIDFNEIEPTYVFPPTSDQIKQTLANNK